MRRPEPNQDGLIATSQLAAKVDGGPLVEAYNIDRWESFASFATGGRGSGFFGGSTGAGSEPEGHHHSDCARFQSYRHSTINRLIVTAIPQLRAFL